MASEFLKRKVEEEKKRQSQAVTAAPSVQSGTSSFLQKKVAEEQERKKQMQNAPAAAKQPVNKPASDKASAGTDPQQTADKRPVTINRPSSINRYMSTDRRNTLHQAALEEAKAQEAEQARQAEAKAQAKLDAAKRVQAQRSGLNQRQALPAEKNTEESATLAHRTAGLRGPIDPEQAARNEAVRLAEDQALRDAYRETYGEEAPEKSVWNQIKLASAANLSGLTKAGQGLINTADFVVNLIPRTLEDTGLLENATDNPVSNFMRGQVEMGQRDAETWDREVAKYSAAQGTTAGKIARFQEQVMQNVPQSVIAVMEAIATGGASAAASLGAPVQGVLPMVQKAVKELAKKPDFWYSFITELGNNYQEALNQGADNDRATVAALTASLANAAIEVGGDTGEGGLETLLQKIGGGQGAMVSWLLSLPEEGLEEVLQGITTRATNAAMFNGDTPLYGQGGVFDKEAAKEEFGSGMAVAAVLGGAQIGANALYNKAGSAIRNKQLGSSTDPVMEQAMQLLQEKMGTENATVLPTQSAQETIERTDDKTVNRQSNPVMALLEKGSASAETLAAKSKGDEGFWNQVDELVNSGQASFDEGGNLYLVNAEDHIDNRTSEYVGNQQVKSFQYLHPELHEYYAKAAQGLLNDLEGSTKASRYQTVETGVGMDTKWQGERRITVEPIARLLDNYGFTYAEVKQGLEDIIQNHGSENYAKAKRLEMVLDDIMTEGYTDIDGMQVEPNQAYIQAKAGIAGAADQYVTDASPDVPDAAGAPAITRDAQTIANDVYRVNRAAAALGENGSKALSAVYGNDEISSRYTPEEIVQGFYEVYNEAMTGKAMSEEAKNRAAALPENVRYMAESSGKEDARRAKQAIYFGKDSKLVRDSNWKKANLSSKTTRKLDALAKVLSVQIKFVEQVDGGQSSGSYQNGVISIALDSESPVMTVAIHEAVHRLREASPGSYAQLAEFVRQNMNEQQWLANFVVDRNDYGADKSLDYLNEEIVADAFGTILNDSGLLEQFAKEHTNILQRMADSIRDIMRSIRKAASMEELKLSRSEKAAFSSLADELRGMERAMRSALKAVEKTGSQAYNISNEARNKRKGSQYGREENRGNEETGRQEGSDTGGRSQVQGTVQRVSGRAGLVLSAQEASKGQRPAVAFNESDVVEPVEGSVVYGEMQIVHSYDVPCFAVSDSVWDEYWKDEGSIPAAFSDKGQVFFRETLSEDQRVKTAYHELTHIMKEVMYQPYIDFISRTMNHLNQQSVFTRQILERAAKSRGIVLNPNMKTADILDWYDEFHAGIYGDIAANNTDDVRWLLDQVFRDFDAYAAELTELHRQFKDSRTGEKFKMKRAREDGKNLIALHMPRAGSAELKAQLESRGVKVLTYNPGKEGDRLKKINSVDGIKFAKNRRQALDDYIAKYGAIPTGEKPARDILLPNQTADDKYVSRTVRTILEAKATPDELVPTVEKLVASGDLSFDSYTDEQAMADADSQIQKVGWASSLENWTQAMNKGEVSKANTAMGWALYNNAANSGDTETALFILNKMVGHQRSAAQALQATRILKKLSPETQLYQAQRSIASLQEELNERYGEKGAPELVIDKDLAEAYLKAKEQEERDAILRDIYRDIGRQMPSRYMDKWNAWRYLAMLGNPRTHVRNIVGNLGFAPVVAAKNLTATAIESVVSRVSGGKLNRTKAIIGTGKQDRALLRAAWSDYDKVQEAALSGGKYSDLGNANKYIEEGRQIFRFKPLDAARKGNSKALDVEDVWFSKPHYAFALASYCKAHNISESEIAKGGKALHKARAYALLEAQKATYRDTNALSQTISSFGRGTNAGKNPVKKGVNLLLEGILPFRKTPANILARSIEYSPIGLMNGIKQAVYDVQKGTKTGAEAIDSISAGLTGTGLMALGIYLAAQGLIRGHGSGDEDENEFEELQGHQAYALELPDGTSITLDWLAPEALPLFVGVNLYEQTGGEAENATMSTILSAVSTVSEPLLEMSCLQSLNDVFDSVGNAANDGLDGLPSALVSSATSYLTQGLPTLLGQIERTGEDKRYTTYTSKNAFLTRDMQYTVGRASARIPGWDYQQIPYIDAWGRTEATGNTGAKAFNNFVNPAYTSEISTSEMEQELQRLFDETGEAGVLPSRAAKYFTVDGERKDLTAEEYIQYATLKGQTAYETLTDLVESKQYRAMSDADKVKAVKNAYDYANQTAKAAISEYQTDSWMQKADEAEKKYGISQEMYISIRTNASGLKSLKDADGNTITNSLSLLKMKLVYDTPGLNEKQRQAMFEYLGVGKKVQHYNKALVEQKLHEMRKKAQ